jgi:hypothetical protein
MLIWDGRDYIRVYIYDVSNLERGNETELKTVTEGVEARNLLRLDVEGLRGTLLCFDDKKEAGKDVAHRTRMRIEHRLSK